MLVTVLGPTIVGIITLYDFVLLNTKSDISKNIVPQTLLVVSVVQNCLVTSVRPIIFFNLYRFGTTPGREFSFLLELPL